jgi:hypothetical protein
MDHWLSAPFDLSKCSPGVCGRQAVHAVASGRRGAERGNGGVSPDLMPRLGVTDWIRPLTNRMGSRVIGGLTIRTWPDFGLCRPRID